MRSLGTTTAQLQRYRRQWKKLAAQQGGINATPSTPGRLKPFESFGSNPGMLLGRCYVPPGLPAGAPLVVVLHGCTQNAAAYDLGAGWSTLADRHGFAVLCPEQPSSNNPNLCFNWFRPEDTARGRGEALSIQQMTEAMIGRHRLNRQRVFITGLSAGGAMAVAMLATYPDLYAGGAIIAGLPYGIASNVQEAFDGMFQGRPLSGRQWGDRVRAASPHRGPWPKLSVWHGSADTTVVPGNAEEIIKQWTDLHGLHRDDATRTMVGRHVRETWSRDGEVVIENHAITGMAHGTPLSTGDGVGQAGPYLIEMGISSSERIVEFWGLAQAAHSSTRTAPRPVPPSDLVPHAASERADVQTPSSQLDVNAVITNALRAAGLMKG